MNFRFLLRLRRIVTELRPLTLLLKAMLVLFALFLLLTSIYWALAGHALRYTINAGSGAEYEEDFSTRGRIIISCLVGAFWSIVAGFAYFPYFAVKNLVPIRVYPRLKRRLLGFGNF